MNGAGNEICRKCKAQEMKYAGNARHSEGDKP